MYGLYNNLPRELPNLHLNNLLDLRLSSRSVWNFLRRLHCWHLLQLRIMYFLYNNLPRELPNLQLNNLLELCLSFRTVFSNLRLSLWHLPQRSYLFLLQHRMYFMHINNHMHNLQFNTLLS